jgi:hypothetical protein
MNSVATEQLWIDFGLDSAVFLDYVAHWLHLNSCNKQPRNYHEGRYWTYNTHEALHSIFPGWPPETIRNIVRKCVKKGLLMVGNFNKKKYDRTNWYSLTDLALQYYPKLSHLIQQSPDNPSPDSSGKSTAASGKSTAAIPKTLTTCSNNTITTNSGSNSKSKAKPNELMRELIEVYRQEFPNNPQPHPRVIATSLQKTLQTLIKKWPELDPDGNPLTRETFQRYLHLLRTTAPKFSLGEYETQNGNRKKNSLETFSRWNTVVKFLENQYS